MEYLNTKQNKCTKHNSIHFSDMMLKRIRQMAPTAQERLTITLGRAHHL